jgi:hypothetical protein
MAGFRIEGNTSGNVAEVDSENNLKVNLATDIEKAGYAVAVSELDTGTVTGTPLRRSPNTSRGERLFVGIDTGIFDYLFNATAQDTGVWKYSFTTMTASQSGGFLQLNANSTLATTTGVSLQTWRTFEIEGHGGQRFEATCIISLPMLANQIIEFGLFLATNTSAPADGVYYRITSAGVFGVLNYNGAETAQQFTGTPYTVGSASAFVIEMTIRGVEFWIDGVLYAIMTVPSGNAEPFLSGGLPICFQQRNSGVVVGTPAQLKVGNCHLTYLEMQLAMPFAHQQCAEGLTGQQGIAGSTQGSSANFPNAVGAIGAGNVLNNTGALVTGLGGQALISAAANPPIGTDGIVFSYQNSLPTVAIKPRILMITGVKIMSVCYVAVTTNPIIYVYSLAFGHTAVSMVTAEGTSFTTNPTTKAPRRVPLGIEVYSSTATAATVGSQEGIYMPFNSPIAVNPGEFVAIVAKNVATALPGSGSFLMTATFDSYWI